MSVSALVFLLSVLSAVCCFTIYTNKQVSRMGRELPCKSQPRAYSISELTPHDDIRFNEPYVVLHRCDRAGCCTDATENCTAVGKEDVIFTVSYYDENGEERFMEVSAENHTRCKCLKRTSTIK